MVDTEDVKSDALLLLGGDYTRWEFESEGAFDEWMDLLVDSVVEDHSDRVPNWTLETPKLRQAAMYELASRMLERSVSLGYGSYANEDVEGLSVGPIKIAPGRRSVSVVTGTQDLEDRYHLRAESLLGQAGLPGRKGAIRVWTPACHTTII